MNLPNPLRRRFNDDRWTFPSFVAAVIVFSVMGLAYHRHQQLLDDPAIRDKHFEQMGLVTHPFETMEDVIILRKFGPFRFQLRSNKNGFEAIEDFCQKLEDGGYPVAPEFEVGLRLEYLKYMDLSDLGKGCWSINPDIRHGCCGYKKMRDGEGNPVFTK